MNTEAIGNFPDNYPHFPLRLLSNNYIIHLRHEITEESANESKADRIRFYLNEIKITSDSIRRSEPF